MKQLLVLFVMVLLVSGCYKKSIQVPDGWGHGNEGLAYAATGDSVVPMGPQLALVIGNSNYEHNPLSNPVNDARDMARVLRELGFEVILKTNLNSQEMEDAIYDFKKLLRRLSYIQNLRRLSLSIQMSIQTEEETEEESVGLFYFSGHGASHQGDNYLIPINNDNIKKEDDLSYRAFNVTRFKELMEKLNNGINIMMLDTCGDNNQYRNNLYTRHLLNAMLESRHSVIEETFEQVRMRVIEESG